MNDRNWPICDLSRRPLWSPLLKRFCCKSPKLLGTNFLVKKLRLVPSPIDRSSSSLPKSPVSLPPENEVPQISIQKSHQQPRKILVRRGKGLLQQNRGVERTSFAQCELFES